MPNLVANSVFEDASEETLISVLSEESIHWVIRVTETAVLPTLRTSPSSSLGDLESLSLELLHAIFAMLDYKTLADISKTCIRGAAVVKSVPQYRDVIQHAPQTVVALSKTRLIRHHCAATVYAALLSSQCVSCFSYGAFLFLPTCQRCCNYCLGRNQSLRVIPISLAKRCFGLSAASVKTLPIMRSIPGRYALESVASRQRPIRLVCVGAAKKLALAGNTSEELMRQDLDAKFHSGLSQAEYDTQSYLLEAPITPPGSDFFPFHPTQIGVREDKFCGMACIPFPYVVPGSHVEHGLWCLGCQALYRQWHQKPIPAHISHLVARGYDPEAAIYGMQQIARSRIDFLKHIHECPGAKGDFFLRQISIKGATEYL